MFFHFLKICPIFFFNSSLWALMQGGAWFPCPVFRLGKQSWFSNYDVQSHVIIKILSSLSGWGSPSSSSGCRGRRTAVGKWGGLLPPITALPLLFSACDGGVWPPQAWSWGRRVGAKESSLKCQFSGEGFGAWQIIFFAAACELFPGEENGNPLQYSCLENPMDRGAWWAPGVIKSWTRLKWLSTCELLVGACRFYHSFPDQGSNPGPLAFRAQGLSHWSTRKSLVFIFFFFKSLKICSWSSITMPGLCSTAAPCGSCRQQQQRMFPGPLGLAEEVRLPSPYSGQSSWDS